MQTAHSPSYLLILPQVVGVVLFEGAADARLAVVGGPVLHAHKYLGSTVRMTLE